MSDVVTEPTLDEHLATIAPIAKGEHEGLERADGGDRGSSGPAAGTGAGSDRATGSEAPSVRPGVSADDDGDDDTAASEAGKTLAGRKKTARERIQQLEWEKHEERRRAERLEGELQALKTPKAEAKPVDDGKPRLKAYTEKIGAEYETYEDAVEAHTEALTDWKSAQAQRASTAATAQRAYQDATARTRAKGTEKHADFDAKAEAFVSEGKAFSPFMAEAIFSDPEMGHEIAYALMTEPETYSALLTAPHLMAATKILGKLLTRLESAPAGASDSKVVPISRASKPITPLGSSPVASDVGSADETDLDAHISRENARDRATARRR